MSLKLVSHRLLAFILLFLNFLHQASNTIKQHTDFLLNKCLDKKVMYYALYSRHDNYYACLYDCRSIWEKLWVALQQVLIKLRLDDNYLFSYDDINSNFECLTSFLINAALIVYVEDGQLKHKLFLHKEKEDDKHSSRKFNYIYCIAEDVDGNFQDLTESFNMFVKEIHQNKTLTCKDFVTIFTQFGKHSFNVNKLYHVKMMPDDTFTEVLFKGNDIIEHL